MVCLLCLDGNGDHNASIFRAKSENYSAYHITIVSEYFIRSDIYFTAIQVHQAHNLGIIKKLCSATGQYSLRQLLMGVCVHSYIDERYYPN